MFRGPIWPARALLAKVAHRALACVLDMRAEHSDRFCHVALTNGRNQFEV
jgi:hypothetical protein